MSKLAAFRAAEKALAKQVAEFEALKHDQELVKELEFDNGLTEFLKAHGMTRARLMTLLSADFDTPEVTPGKTRKSPAFQERTFKNPHTQETVTVRSLNHGTIRAWVAEHGTSTVKSWEQATSG